MTLQRRLHFPRSQPLCQQLVLSSETLLVCLRRRRKHKLKLICMDLLFDVALLEATQLKKVLMKSKQDTHMLYPSGSDDEVSSQPKVPHELKEKTTSTNEGTGVSGDDDDSNDDDSDDDEEEKQDDEFVRTPEHYVPIEDETNDESDDVTEEEYERINEELYGDVNVSLKDVEPTDKEEGDVEMTVAGQVNVNQEDAGNQVKDDAQATQKTKGPIPSSSISSDYAAKYLNFDNISSVDTEVVSLLDINVQHKVSRTSPLLTIPVSVIPEHTIINPPKIVTTASSTTISSILITDLEKDVKELKTVDHSATLLSTIKSKVLNAVKEYLGTSLDDALYKVLQKHSVDITKEHSVPVEIVKRLRQQYDEDAMDEGVADKLKKRKHDNADKDKGPSAGSDRGLKRQKTSKDTEPPKKAKSTETSKGTSKSQPKSTVKSAQADETVQIQSMIGSRNLKGLRLLIQTRMLENQLTLGHLKALTDRLDWNNPERKEYSFDLSKPLPLIMVQGHQVVLVHYFINNDLKYLRGGSTSKKYTTSTTKTKAAKYDILGIEDMVPLLWSPVKVAYDRYAVWGISH
ncbi:hypothetical protein Tco_0026743 [Tanacetum coccineum]